MWLFFLAIVIIGAVILKKAHNSSDVESGKYDNSIALLQNYYAKARLNHEALGVDVISIGTYWFELDGRVDSSSSYMSVCLRDGTNDDLADSLGMEVRNLCGKKYYQYVVKGKFSRTLKKEILKKLSVRLSEDFQNDIFKIDETIPSLYAMIDCKDIMEYMPH